MYSLIPHGAVIICESAADYDENVPMPPVSEEQESHMVEEITDKDPVVKTLDKMTEMYRKYIQPLMNMSYHPDNSQDIYQTIDTINHAISKITEKLVKQISKMSGYMMIRDKVYGERYCGDKFYSHLGLILKNKKRLVQLGLGEYAYTTDRLPMFAGDWQICAILNTVLSKPDLLDTFMDPDTFQSMIGSDRDMIGMFNGIVDFMQALYEDRARLARMEKSHNRTLFLSGLIDRIPYESDEVHTLASTPESWSAPRVVQFISRITRKSMQDLYEIQCDAIDGKTDVDLSKVLTRTVNLYGIASMYIMYMAYQLRDTYSWVRAVDTYTDQLLAELKS